MKALLDTHVLLHWLSSSSKLSKAQKRVIRQASDANPLWISEISLWEVAVLYERDRIQLQLPLRDWLETATAPPLVQRIGITPAIAAEVAALPAWFHRDPADRIIVASTRILNATLLTQDQRIIDAGLVSTLS